MRFRKISNSDKTSIQYLVHIFWSAADYLLVFALICIARLSLFRIRDNSFSKLETILSLRKVLFCWSFTRRGFLCYGSLPWFWGIMQTFSDFSLHISVYGNIPQLSQNPILVYIQLFVLLSLQISSNQNFLHWRGNSLFNSEFLSSLSITEQKKWHYVKALEFPRTINQTYTVIEPIVCQLLC